ncbi:hypothetical protein [Streptomyces sp. NPDC018036]|uniref:hypothetical protein n=1 Tax=Streptomyces sp. NPDC018036 TaxID=3365035 RepID=UPI0037B0626F
MVAMQWILSGYGSARFIWMIGSERVEIPSSYIGDALDGLMQAALDLQLGSSATFAYFMGEPDGYRMFFSGASDEVYVQVVHFVDLQSEEGRWAGGTVSWAGRVGKDAFIDDVCSMGEKVIRDNGSDGYERAWGKPFPASLLQKLKSGRG